MDSTQQPIDAQLFLLVSAAVEEGMGIVQHIAESGGYFFKYSQWNKVVYQNNGMPKFQTDTASEPPTYKEVIGWKTFSTVHYEQVSSYQALIQYAASQPRIISYMASHIVSDVDEPMIRRRMINFASGLLERYLYTYPAMPFSAELLLPLYLPVECFYLSDSLYSDVIVPILFVNCEFDHFELLEAVSIDRLSEDIQLARAERRRFDWGADASTLQAATHALIIRDWEMPNHNIWETEIAFGRSNSYPLNVIDAFFAALRTVTDFDTGYAELLLSPQNWAHEYIAFLPPLEGGRVQQYPRSIEVPIYVTADPPVLTVDVMARVKRVFAKLVENTDSRLGIAMRRLNRCLLREEEDDSILDATIALEALLGDSAQEMTFKLSMRLAALLQLSPENKSGGREILKRAKQIYTYRSLVAHGSKDADNHREIGLSNGQKIRTVHLAIQYLRLAIAVLVSNPQYLKPSAIDEALLLHVPQLKLDDETS